MKEGKHVLRGEYGEGMVLKIQVRETHSKTRNYARKNNLEWCINSFGALNHTYPELSVARATLVKFNKWKIAKLRQSCDSFCVHNLKEITFVCSIATDNFCFHNCKWKHLSPPPIVNFCMPYCNCQRFFYCTISFVWTTATVTTNITLLQFLTFKCNFYALM